MGNDLSIKPRERSNSENDVSNIKTFIKPKDQKDSTTKVKSNKKASENSTSQNADEANKFDTSPKNQMFAEKRRRFRELVSLQLVKKRSIKDEIIKVFPKNRTNDVKLKYMKSNMTDKTDKSELLTDFNTVDTDCINNEHFQCVGILGLDSETSYKKCMPINELEKETLLDLEKTNNNRKQVNPKARSEVETNFSNSISNCNQVNDSSDTSPFGAKTQNDNLIRNKYYTQLILNNCWGRKKQDAICQNIFIFDWDDTIMCTTYITPTGYFTEKHLRELELKKDPEVFKNLEVLIIKVLSYAIEQGDTYIITNAASGWVEYSTRLFFPNVLPLLSKIIIISARGWFEKEFPRNSKLWKLTCFEEIGKIQNKQKTTNIIVLGDSLIEMEAAYVLGKNFDKCFVKTIKLKDAPSPSQLLKQLNLLSVDLSKIVRLHATIAISVQKQKRGGSLTNSNLRTTYNKKSRNRITGFDNSKVVPRDLQRFSVI